MTCVYSIQAFAAGKAGDDRARAVELGGSLALAIADGAGGVSFGGAAADAAVAQVLAGDAGGNGLDARYWAGRLMEIDSAIARGPSPGETTLVVLCVSQGRVAGASVGDSVAWMIDDGSVQDLTAASQRKPLLGSGMALPRGFGPVALGSATLLVATDGLWKYASREAIAAKVRAMEVPGPLAPVVDLVRLKSGALQDDVAVALVRAR